MTQAPQERAVVKYDANKPIQAAGGLPAFAGWLQSRKGSISQVAASFMSPERTIKVMLNNFDKNPALFKCTGNSIWRCLMQCVELGLEPGGALGLAHLIPFGDVCTVIIDYKGIEGLCYKSGMIQSITANVVYEGDRFVRKLGTEQSIEHEPGDCEDAAKITHAYCVVKLVNGGLIFDSMSRKQIESIRGRSKAKNNGPWVTDYAEMCKKTVIRRVLKHCPKSIEVQKALALEDRNDTGGADPLFDFEIIEGECRDVSPTHGNEAVKGKLGGPDWQEATIPFGSAIDAATGEVIDAPFE